VVGWYRELEFRLDQANSTLWCFMCPNGAPSFTRTLLRELIAVRCSIQQLFSRPGRAVNEPIQYFVGGSRLPHIYNLGGDLAFFIESIRSGNRDALRSYAHDCIDVAYHMWTGFDVPVITIALVQGDALGGGFEGALSFNVLVAERSAKFGLPEILFNLFPGMGAFSLLSRKLDTTRAQQMIMSGKIYSAEDLYKLGLVDVLADDGKGEDAVRDYIARNARHHVVHRTIYQARRRVNPLSFEELRDIAEMWVELAMQLTPADLRKMERLMSMQARRIDGSSAAAANVA
jgi:DSF synthase